MNFNFVFFGTSRFATNVLDELAKAGFLPALIVTVPDAPKGRKRVLTPTPVKLWALEHNIPISQPKNFSVSGFNFSIPVPDLFIVADYGKILPKRLLDIPKRGSLNVHASLLPAFRGPSPMQTALLKGVEETGVTIMEVAEKLDEGAIIAEEKIDLAMWQPTFSELAQKSAIVGGELLAHILPEYAEGKIVPRSQDHAQATFTKKFTVGDARIPVDVVLGKIDGEDAIRAERMVRALNPEPGTWTELPVNGKTSRLKILSAHLENEKFVPDLIQPDGKKQIRWKDFLRGNKLGPSH